MYIYSVLKGVLLDMEQVHCGVYRCGLLQMKDFWRIKIQFTAPNHNKYNHVYISWNLMDILKATV